MPRPRESAPVEARVETRVKAPVHMSIAEILEKRRRPKPHDLIPTDVEGVDQLAEAGKRPDILQETLGELAIMGADYTARDTLLKELAEEQEKLNDAIKEIAQKHKGLRGIQSELDNFKLIVGPSPHIEWKHPVLQELLGELAYAAHVSAKLEVSIAIPLGYQTKEGPLTPELLQAALMKGLVDLGLPEAGLGLIINPQIVGDVDVKGFADLLDRGQVSSFEEAGEVTETWTIIPKPLRKS